MLNQRTAAVAPSAGPFLFGQAGVVPFAAQVGIGIACASFWRGAWYVLDDNLFPENPVYSATASLGLGTTGLAMTQGLIAHCNGTVVNNNNHLNTSPSVKHQNNITKFPSVTKYKIPTRFDSVARFGCLYAVSMSIVLIWRGTWMLWDIGYENIHKGKFKASDKDHQTKSGLASHFMACGCLLMFGRFSAVLAPPFSRAILNDKTFRASTWKEYATRVFR
jgi:hypothetical protein